MSEERAAGVVFVPDRGGQREHALHDADAAGVRHSWRSRARWPLKMSLVDWMTWHRGLENRGPVDRVESTTHTSSLHHLVAKTPTSDQIASLAPARSSADH